MTPIIIAQFNKSAELKSRLLDNLWGNSRYLPYQSKHLCGVTLDCTIRKCLRWYRTVKHRSFRPGS